ncbi:hypothetical protein DH09_03910 [Bacillaceae bacterium JMAK1]|nr:hypothetical protein DH09_03910 [Bacillaceae bacterium JMAK1]
MDWLTISLQMAGGLAIFLYGMYIASDGLKRAASTRLRTFLQKVTKNQVYGALAGIVLAAAMQSSTAATVMTVGFVNAGLISLRRALGVMLGSAVGTTLTVQLIAFSITDYALAFVTLGVLLFLINIRIRSYGSIILGFGFVFFGMGLMTGAMEPLQYNEQFTQWMTLLSGNLWLAVFAGIAFTAVIQNSAATIAIAMTLASTGAISLEAGVGLVYGANFGTVFTAMISSLTATIDAKRAAVAHAIFKFIGVLIFLPFTTLFIQLLTFIGGDLERQLANAHTLFNVVNVIVLLPFCNRFAILMERLMPKSDRHKTSYHKYIDQTTAKFPTVGLLQARKEIEHMLARVQSRMFPELLQMMESDRARKIIMEEEKVIDSLYKTTFHHLRRITEQHLKDSETNEAIKLLSINNDVERQTNVMKEMARALSKLEARQKELNHWERANIEALYKEVSESFVHTSRAFVEHDTELAIRVVYNNPKVQRMEREMRYGHFYHGSGSSSTVSMIYADVMNGMLRIHQHNVNLSQTLLDRV